MAPSQAKHQKLALRRRLRPKARGRHPSNGFLYERKKKVAQTLAQFLCEFDHRSLPAEVVERGKALLLDQLGCELLRSTLEWNQPVYRFVRETRTAPGDHCEPRRRAFGETPVHPKVEPVEKILPAKTYMLTAEDRGLSRLSETLERNLSTPVKSRPGSPPR